MADHPDTGAQEDPEAKTPRVRPVAVIDIGSASVRMEIAQIDAAGGIHALESLRQTVHLGKDSFTGGAILKETIEECVKVLQSFRMVLAEYEVRDDRQILAVATSAVREAVNRDEFVDRLYIATGIDVRVLDDAEVNRLTYLAVEPFLRTVPALLAESTMIVEVGGGSTELMLLQQGMMTFSGVYRLGSQRMTEMLEAYRAPATRIHSVMASHIQRTMDQIAQSVPLAGKPVNLVVMGGDARFVVTQLNSDWRRDGLAQLKAKDLAAFAEGVYALSVDELVQRFHMAYLDAELLGPALMTLIQLADTFRLKKMYVAPTTLRQGLLTELAHGRAWTEEFTVQIHQVALDLGRKFRFDEPHSVHVASLCLQLFDQLAGMHKLGARNRLLLHVAALLHEIGEIVSTRNHHKHSMYLILNSELFGLSREDLRLVALVARYHRRSPPRKIHEVYGTLEREDRILVAKMAALLRVADALDRRHDQHIRRLDCSVEDEAVVVRVADVDDLTLEAMALQQKGNLFDQVYGQSVELRVQKGIRNGRAS
jgi:exopolyphosphatase / guanosine-5'-triphosphate,3'-diphosphate pyrophosphatase